MQAKINSLQVLRAVAVSLVILVHAIHFGMPILTKNGRVDLFYNFRDWGTIGVDIFFTISGFIMVIVIPSYLKPGGWKQFFIKRIIRIFPLYFLLSALDVIISVFLKHESMDWRQILKTILFIPFFDGKVFISPLLSVGWSLSYEIYFYLLIGLLLTITKKVTQTLLFLLPSLVFLGIILNPESVLLKFLLSPFLIEFGLGVAIGLIYKYWSMNIRVSKFGKMVTLLILTTGIISLIMIIFVPITLNIHDAEASENNILTALVRAIVCGIPSSFLLLGLTTAEFLFKLKMSQIIIRAGDASYSAYLIHMKIFPAVAHVFAYLSISATFYLILIIPICLGVSILFYNIVERRLILIIDKLFSIKASTVIKS